MRVLATAGIVLLLVVDLVLLPMGGVAGGVEPRRVRADVAGADAMLGRVLPDFTLPDLEGHPVRLSDLRGHRVLITFERSLDW